MKRPIIIAAIALIELGALSPEARAGDDGAIAAGVIGGLAVGALAGAAIADANRPPAVVYDDYNYVTVYRPRRRIHVYRYEEPPYYGYHYYRGYRYDDGSWPDD
jgi:hypothetical protein